MDMFYIVLLVFCRFAAANDTNDTDVYENVARVEVSPRTFELIKFLLGNVTGKIGIGGQIGGDFKAGTLTGIEGSLEGGIAGEVSGTVADGLVEGEAKGALGGEIEAKYTEDKGYNVSGNFKSGGALHVGKNLGKMEEPEA